MKYLNQVAVNSKLKWLPYIIMGYMAMAFIWWACLLWRKNDQIFLAQSQLLEIKFSPANGGINITQFQQTKEFLNLVKTRDGQRKMIVGEAIFFILILITGFYLILRATAKEIYNEHLRQNFQLSITHELKSPVAAIQLILDTLIQRELPDDKRKGLYKTGVKETKRLNDLINDILLAANLEYGWQPNKEPILLRAIATIALHRIKLRYPDVQIKEVYDDTLKPIHLDKTGIEAVLYNLLENAVKYNDNTQKQLDISIESLPTGGQRISIIDNGNGIAQEEKKKVFQKFYRSGAEGTRQTKGTGLGLYIVYQIVLAHGGALVVKDNKPRGTIFQIDFPNKTSL
jgi:signal transduction histidine kinase